MPLRAPSRRLEPGEQGEPPLIRYSDFSGGVGTHYAKEDRADLRSALGYWYGRLDTWIPGQVTLPLSAIAATAPANISNSKTDYACMKECYLGGHKVILVKGERAWYSTGTTWTECTSSPISNAQGRQLLWYSTLKRLYWFAGANARSQYTTDGDTWTTATTEQYFDCGFTRGVAGGFALTPAGYLYTISDTPVFIQSAFPAQTAAGTIPLGILSDPYVAFVVSGPLVWQFGSSSVHYLSGEYQHGMADCVAACRLSDEFALTDGSRIIRWHPSRPLGRDISIWQEDGCPSDMKGKVKALQSIGPYLMAWWELDGSEPKTIIFWSRPNLQGQTTWHPRMVDVTGEFPLSIGSPMTMAEQTVTDLRRFWVVTADGSDGRTYYQTHPFAGLNPLNDSNAAIQYQDGYEYLYTPWEELILMGDDVGALTEVERNAELTSTETMTVDYRLDYDAYTEEAGSAGWKTGLTINDTKRTTKIRAGTGDQGKAAQFKVGLDRGGTATTTPVLHDLGTTVKRTVRAPSKRTV